MALAKLSQDHFPELNFLHVELPDLQQYWLSQGLVKTGRDMDQFNRTDEILAGNKILTNSTFNGTPVVLKVHTMICYKPGHKFTVLNTALSLVLQCHLVTVNGTL